jgi:hypothetical protein
MAEGIMVDLCRDFWIREKGTGQQVMMMMMTNKDALTESNKHSWFRSCFRAWFKTF